MPNGRGIAVKALRSLPKQKLVTVIMSNGASISMPMAVRKFMDKYRMTVDPTNHPLWSGKAVQVRAHRCSPTEPCSGVRGGSGALRHGQCVGVCGSIHPTARVHACTR